MDYQSLKVEMRGHIAHIVLDCPEKRNSMGAAFWTEFPKVVADLSDSGSTRVIVISASGPHFSSGMDLSVFTDEALVGTDTPRERERLMGIVQRLQGGLTILEQCRVPVLAAVHGGCIGAALDLVCACDMRYATKDGFFQIKETEIGMMADLGTLQRMIRLMPEGVVRKLAFTGEKLKSERAYCLGFTCGLFDTPEEMLSHVFEVAETIESHSPLAIRFTKSGINFARDHTVADALQWAALAQAAIFDIEEVQASISSGSGGTPMHDDLLSVRQGI